MTTQLQSYTVENPTMSSIDVLMAEPRGFCAGVDRAIEIVERALEKFGAPIYVRHEIVHNTFVVNDLKSKGAIFIEDLNDVPAYELSEIKHFFEVYKTLEPGKSVQGGEWVGHDEAELEINASYARFKDSH